MSETPQSADSPETETGAVSRPVPKPSAIKVPKPAALARPKPAQAAAPVAPVATNPQDPALVAAAKQFGSVDADGTVSVRDGDVTRVVGQVPGASQDEALDLYIRRYLDLRTKVALFETRLKAGSVSPHDATSTLKSLHDELREPNAVGDLPCLRDQLTALEDIAKQQAEQADKQRQEAREKAIAERTAIVEQAEQLASQDPARVQWKTAGDQMNALLDQWKHAQKNGPRIDRPTEEELWKRFSHARTAFDRERRHFFAALEEQHAAARAAKEKLIAQAEKLSTSIAWGETAAAFRDLMAQWKQAGHAGRKDDDALWARFRAAQDAFFTARNAANQELDAQYAENLKVKQALLEEAEALLPISDLNFAKTRLRDIQDRWEAAGKVPRDAINSVESRLRAVEKAVRDFEEEQWQRSNPEVKARADGLSAQLYDAIARLEKELSQAQAKGNTKKATEIEEGLAARKAWLAQIEKAAQEA